MQSLNLNKPHLIIMVGIPGSGKSYFAQHFADTFSAPLISYDGIHAGLFGTSSRGNDQSQIIGRIAMTFLDEMLKAKMTIVYDGASDSQRERMILSQKARKAGFETLYVWVQTEPTTARERAAKLRKNTPTISKEQFDSLLKKFHPPTTNEKPIVISGKHTYQTQLKIVLKRLVQPRVELTHQQAPIVAPRPLGSRNILIR